jgi:homoserine dehydrogenase
VTFDLILVGFGHVAQRFVRLLDEQRATLARDFGATVRIVGVATRRHGHTFSARGLGAVRLKPDTTYGDPGGSPPRSASRRSRTVDDTDTRAFLRNALGKSRVAARQRRLVVVETTTLDVVRGEPAGRYTRTALAGGAHVITTNKGPVACAHRALERAANRADRRWLFEGAVMDGVPIFNLVRETLPAVRVKGFCGVVNSTTNYMLTAMEQGRGFDEALRDMQASGVAEADASLDVEGWDAAAKTAALANVLLGARITPAAVAREGLTRDTAARAVKAREAGRRLKLVARAARDGPRVSARVGLEELGEDHLLAGLDGQQNALILHTDLVEDIAIVQRGGGLTQTAYALLTDLLTIVRAVTPSAATRRRRPRARRD